MYSGDHANSRQLSATLKETESEKNNGINEVEFRFDNLTLFADSVHKQVPRGKGIRLLRVRCHPNTTSAGQTQSSISNCRYAGDDEMLIDPFFGLKRILMYF